MFLHFSLELFQWPLLVFFSSSCFLWHEFFIISHQIKCSLKIREGFFDIFVSTLYRNKISTDESIHNASRLYCIVKNPLNTCAVKSPLEVRDWKEKLSKGENSIFFRFSFFPFRRRSQLDKQKQSVIDKMSSNYSPQIMFSNRSSFIICRRLIKAFYSARR